MGFRKIKTHTSNEWYSGTNSRLDISLKMDDQESTSWHTLNTGGYWNGMERGETNRYFGQVLRDIREEAGMKDYLEFYPSKNLTYERKKNSFELIQ